MAKWKRERVSRVIVRKIKSTPVSLGLPLHDLEI